MTQKSDNKTGALLEYIVAKGDDCHISEAMWRLHLSEEEVLELIKDLPVASLPYNFKRAAYPREHKALASRAVAVVREYGLRPNTEVKIGGYKFDAVGFDHTNKPLLAIECGVISNKRRLKRAFNSVGMILHWPYGKSGPHPLGRCKGCKLWKV